MSRDKRYTEVQTCQLSVMLNLNLRSLYKHFILAYLSLCSGINVEIATFRITLLPLPYRFKWSSLNSSPVSFIILSLMISTDNSYVNSDNERKWHFTVRASCFSDEQ